MGETRAPAPPTDAARLTRARRSACLSPADLAAQRGMSQKALRAVEEGTQALDGRLLKWVEEQERGTGR